MTDERIHKEYEELSRVLLKSADKDTRRCGKAFGIGGRGEAIKIFPGQKDRKLRRRELSLRLF